MSWQACSLSPRVLQITSRIPRAAGDAVDLSGHITRLSGCEIHIHMCDFRRLAGGPIGTCWPNFSTFCVVCPPLT